MARRRGVGRTVPVAIATALLSVIGVSATSSFVVAGFTITALEVASAAVSVGLTAASAALSAPSLKGTQTDAATGQQTLRQAVPPRRIYVGRVRISGPLMLYEVNDGVCYQLIALGQGPFHAIDNLFLNDQLVTVGANNFVLEAPYNGEIVAMRSQLGTATQTALAELTSKLPTIWTSNHRLRGIATLLIAAGSCSAQDYIAYYPGGLPKGRVDARTSLVYDPRKDSTVPGGSGSHRFDDPATWEYSRNYALTFLHFLRHPDGFNIRASAFTGVLAEWGAAADVSADPIPLKAGGTESRYLCDGGWSTDEPRKSPLARFLAAGDGKLSMRGDGQILLKPGKFEAPTITIPDDAILGYEIVHGNGALSVANTIRGTYVSPDHDYQEVDAEAWVNAADVLVRGEKEQSLPLAMVQSFSQARRLMKRAAIRANPKWALSGVRVDIRGFELLDQRFATFVFDDIGEPVIFEIRSLSMNFSNLTVTLDLISIDADLDAWNAATEEGTPPPVVSEQETSTGPIPQNLTASVVYSAAGPILRVSCDANADTLLRLRVEYAEDGTSDFVQINGDAGDWSLDSGPLSAGLYDVRARFLKFGAIYARTATIENVNVGSAAAPSAPSGFTAVNASGVVTLTATSPNHANHRALRFWRNSTASFSGATDLGVIYSASNAVVTTTNSPGVGTWYYYVTSEYDATARSSAVGPQSVTVV
jgi:hypothetical protein